MAFHWRKAVLTIVHITYHDGTNIGSCPIGQTGGFENADGNGEIHCFRIFDGVSVMLMQLEMGSYTEIRTQVGVLEVNFCINGRFETSFSMRNHVLLKPGDMAISCYDGLHGTKSESHFPLGYYEGLCLEIDPAAAGHWIRLNAPAFPIDFTALKQNLLGSKWYMVGPAGPRCEHVFRELYESASYAERGFLQLKVLELMLLLGRIPQERAADPYCSAEQTALAHHLRDHLLTNREGYVSLAQLAAEHAISVSHLQKLFKQVYTGAVASSFINHMAGLPLAVLLLLTIGSGELAALPEKLTGVPMWAYLGGIIGVLIIVITNVVLRKLSTFQVSLLLFVGQVFSSAAIDIFMGTDSSGRVFYGGVLVAAGILLNTIFEKNTRKHCRT